MSLINLTVTVCFKRPIVKISGQSLRFYCEDCETGICSSCTDIEHREHATVRMSDAVDAEKEELKKLVERARTQVGYVVKLAEM